MFASECVPVWYFLLLAAVSFLFGAAVERYGIHVLRALWRE